ncbi:hypothetical protein B0X68_05165 [Helicobacter pylori]|uniref:Uncharacterized protein n=1 Tax=Helicobacter pylori TaxID=210 RepID=A0A4Y4XI97_HELPX|nr:hypothetical protein B0X68_05165 [Helicobacter pylori]RPF69661.1 hypothetical protein EGV97_03615 [Helicobacter pylori]
MLWVFSKPCFKASSLGSVFKLELLVCSVVKAFALWLACVRSLSWCVAFFCAPFFSMIACVIALSSLKLFTVSCSCLIF